MEKSLIEPIYVDSGPLHRSIYLSNRVRLKRRDGDAFQIQLNFYTKQDQKRSLNSKFCLYCYTAPNLTIFCRTNTISMFLTLGFARTSQFYTLKSPLILFADLFTCAKLLTLYIVDTSSFHFQILSAIRSYRFPLVYVRILGKQYDTIMIKKFISGKVTQQIPQFRCPKSQAYSNLTLKIHSHQLFTTAVEPSAMNIYCSDAF